jgi:hypothetical protein
VIKHKEVETSSIVDSRSCQKVVEELRLSLSNSMEELKGVEKQIEFEEFVMEIFVDKVEEGEKELLQATEDHKKTKVQFELLGHKAKFNNVWTTCLVQQIQRMVNGCGLTNCPLIIENLTTIPEGHHDTLYVKPCRICEFFFKCHNIMVSSYGCTYHAFCMGVHLEINKGVFWVIPTWW